MEVIGRAALLAKLGQPLEPQDPVLSMLTGADLEQYLETIDPPPEYYEIDAEARLYLKVGGTGKREAFANAFKTAWEKVDADDRAVMREFWSAASHENGFWIPPIDLEDNVSLVGRYNADDYRFGFNSRATDEAIHESRIVDMIGHEIGHAFCHTDPDSHLNDPDASLEDRENEANLKAMQWRFDMKGLKEWGDEKLKFFYTVTGNPAYRQPFTAVPDAPIAASGLPE